MEEQGEEPSEWSVQVVCRYGRGCTHLSDPSHKSRFWHAEELKSFDADANALVCNECGFSSEDAHELLLHMQRKTAWSHKSLIGCRVSVLLDSRDWQDGFVTHCHKSGKHCIDFKQPAQQKRWLNMRKTAFYIVERPHTQQPEAKEAHEVGQDANLAPIEKWVFCEQMDVNFVRAQSMVHRIYGNKVQETGHRTMGHLCLTEEDRDFARTMKGSLLYGELLPRGINRALDCNHLDARNGRVLFDLGMGTGKVVLQVFLQYPNLLRVYGVELSLARFRIAEAAMLKLCSEHPDDFEVAQHVQGRSIVVADKNSPEPRVLQMEWNNLLKVRHINQTDLVLLETDIPDESLLDLACLLYQIKEGARILSYLDFRKIWDLTGAMPFQQLDVNRSMADRFPTSWSVQRGHHFFVWEKTCEPLMNAAEIFLSLGRDQPPFPVIPMRCTNGGGGRGQHGRARRGGSLPFRTLRKLLSPANRNGPASRSASECRSEQGKPAAAADVIPPPLALPSGDSTPVAHAAAAAAAAAATATTTTVGSYSAPASQQSSPVPSPPLSLASPLLCFPASAMAQRRGDPDTSGVCRGGDRCACGGVSAFQPLGASEPAAAAAASSGVTKRKSALLPPLHRPTPQRHGGSGRWRGEVPRRHSVSVSGGDGGDARLGSTTNREVEDLVLPHLTSPGVPPSESAQRYPGLGPHQPWTLPEWGKSSNPDSPRPGSHQGAGGAAASASGDRRVGKHGDTSAGPDHDQAKLGLSLDMGNVAASDPSRSRLSHHIQGKPSASVHPQVIGPSQPPGKSGCVIM